MTGNKKIIGNVLLKLNIIKKIELNINDNKKIKNIEIKYRFLVSSKIKNGF